MQSTYLYKKKIIYEKCNLRTLRFCVIDQGNGTIEFDEQIDLFFFCFTHRIQEHLDQRAKFSKNSTKMKPRSSFGKSKKKVIFFSELLHDDIFICTIFQF